MKTTNILTGCLLSMAVVASVGFYTIDKTSYQNGYSAAENLVYSHRKTTEIQPGFPLGAYTVAQQWMANR